jgi:hypothetical protein
MIKNASLGDVHDGLSAKARLRLKNPPQEHLLIDNPDLLLSINIFMSTLRASQDTYNAVRQNILQRYPDSTILSYDQVKRQITEFTGISSIAHDMCPKSCLAYVGPWANQDCCPTCGTMRYTDPRKRTPQQKFHTIPLGPQLQALYRTPEGADAMRYREIRTQAILAELELNDGCLNAYNDIFCGSDYLDNIQNRYIKSGDITLMLSLDGAQLYKNKASDTWIFIWVVLEHSPDMRYKKQYVLPGGFIP